MRGGSMWLLMGTSDGVWEVASDASVCLGVPGVCLFVCLFACLYFV